MTSIWDNLHYFPVFQMIMPSRIKCEVDLRMNTGTLNLEEMLIYPNVAVLSLANSFDVPLNFENLHDIFSSTE